ncbi:MAG: hypothetical protein KKG59_06515, partial [Nanoarchaeota archaeon]|nr:hypothetical protein [Nanoarchaeota archaeon]
LISAKADTPYHNLPHTVEVTLTMREILKGKAILKPVDADNWFNSLMAALHHDVGLLRNLFEDDSHESGSTGASLYPVHVERSTRFVRKRYGEEMDAEAVAGLIEYTQFPVPSGLDDHGSYGGLLRAADYIGQFTDPNLRRMNVNLLSEFREAGMADQFGYKNVQVLLEKFPEFFSNSVEGLLGPAIGYLNNTLKGNELVRSLYGGVKFCEKLGE